MNDQLLDSIIRHAVDTHAENGAAYVITKDGKELFSGSAGLADVENKVPFTADTLCRAFSCTKIATAVSCMLLVERGRLDTNWELSWLFPEYRDAFYVKDGKKQPSPPIRIRDLLNMTSGIAYPGGSFEGVEGINSLWGRLDASIRNGSSLTTEEFARQAASCALSFPAGQEWQYGSSADILGAVIEKVSGMKLSVFMRENIFAPLGMEDTAFFVPPEKKDRLAVLYENAAEHPKKLGWINLCIYDCEEEPAFLSGGAGLFTTANDYSKLGAALSSGGLLSRKTIEFLQHNGLSPEQRKTLNWDSVRGFGYANLLRIHEDPNVSGLLASPGSFSWDGWTGTYLMCDPSEKLSVTLFIQRAGAGTTPLSRSIINAAYSLI